MCPNLPTLGVGAGRRAPAQHGRRRLPAGTSATASSTSRSRSATSAAPPATRTLEVSAFGITQTYHGVRTIVADGGAGRDTIDVGAGVLADADLSRRRRRRPADLPRHRAGHAPRRGGDDVLEASGPGTSRIFADGGDDTIVGGPAATVVRAPASSAALTDRAPDRRRLDHRPRRTSGASSSGARTATTLSPSPAGAGTPTIDGVNGFDSLDVAFGGGGTVAFRHSGPVGRGRVSV